MTNTKAENFEAIIVPHLNAAYNLARWLTRDGTDAEDVVQEAYLRAFKFFDGFHGGDGRAWVLKIVRNTCYSWLQKNRGHEIVTEFDEEQHSGEGGDPEAALIGKIDSQILKRLLEELPLEFREVVILRELEGLSYREIAVIADLPLGTVMSRLARARQRLQTSLTAYMKGESE
ncbi:MAG TPA: sigma-70 family RNA polymerase sigma factor [Pyrinomonadaceae bacterium]|nr:sigma-70 family RNA polymerase sigma factor [Pyrinomonadaceae bacterium]